jgi:glycerol uptake facilitator-like aquaporin
MEKGIRWNQAFAYMLAQFAGGIAGAVIAHAMFGLPAISISHHIRSGPAQVFSEFVATFGLLCVIWGCVRSNEKAVPFAVGAYITAAYWFAASTSCANPAVTLERCLSDTFAGIRPLDVPEFVVAQIAGGVAATFLFGFLLPSRTAEKAVIPHSHRQ